jgi:hypothetical protein
MVAPMNDPAENPYAAPQAELGSTRLREDQPRRRRPPPRWLWPFLVLLNAIMGLILSADMMITPYHTAGILAGIVVVGTPYALLEMVLRRRQFEFLSDMLYFGAALRIPFQLYPVADFFAGVGAHMVLDYFNWNNFRGAPSPLSNFLLTVFTGVQLAAMAFVLGILPAAVYYAGRTRR